MQAMKTCHAYSLNVFITGIIEWMTAAPSMTKFLVGGPLSWVQ